MSRPCSYTVSILDNYSDIPDADIIATVYANIPVDYQDRIREGEPFTWYEICEDLLPLSRKYPASCICVTETPYYSGDGYESRFLFYGGQCVYQKPELVYPLFTPNNFEYWVSGKE